MAEIERHYGNTVYTPESKKSEVCEVMHIEWDVDRKDMVEWIGKIKPDTVFLHSIVPIWFTRELSEETGIEVVHSPSRWDSYHAVRFVFPKYTSSIQWAMYLRKIGIEKVDPLGSPEITEAIKLLDCMYDWWNALFAEYARQFCAKHELDFNIVYDDANFTYNDWCKKLDKSQLCRPIMVPIEWWIPKWEVLRWIELLEDSALKQAFEKLNQDNIDMFIERQKNQ